MDVKAKKTPADEQQEYFVLWRIFNAEFVVYSSFF